VIEQLVRSRKWANHNTCDRLPGGPLGSSGENVSGEAAARCDVEGSERQLLLRKRRSRKSGGAGGEKRWTAESELRSYGRARACISLANTHPTQHRRLRRSSPRSKQRQSAKGTPARAYEHHQHGASAFVQVPSTTSPLVCPRRLTVPLWPKRAPVQRRRAHRRQLQHKLCFWQPDDALCTLLRASSSPKGNASVREMYLNIDAVAMHEPGTVDCALAAAAVLGSFIARC
jgi:hypothetical protein